MFVVDVFGRRLLGPKDEEGNELQGGQGEPQEVRDLDEVVVEHAAVHEPEAADGKTRQDHVERKNFSRPGKFRRCIIFCPRLLLI